MFFRYAEGDLPLFFFSAGGWAFGSATHEAISLVFAATSVLSPISCSSLLMRDRLRSE